MTESAASTLTNYPLIRSGKVRDIYDAGDRLLLVASDRLSAFDVILPTPIEGKGEILTRISEYWFGRTGHIVPNHLVSTDVDTLDLSSDERDALRGRTMIAQRADRIDIECVVRGYLAGSGYKEYTEHGTLAGKKLPTGLHRGDRLPEPRFTPAIKNDEGHDENVSRERLGEIVGPELARELEEVSLAIYSFAADQASQAGIVLADTKFEFGYVDGVLTLIDELLTPDSSRYWDADAIVPGEEPPSFDKQIVRNWLEAQPWDKTPPGPQIPADIANRTRQRYQEVLDRLTAIPEKGTSQLATTAQQWIVEAEIMPKTGVNDPQGDAVLSGLKLLGFDQADRVRVGKLIRVMVTASSEAEARQAATRMCDRLLANPVIEEYELSVTPAESAEGRG